MKIRKTIPSLDQRIPAPPANEFPNWHRDQAILNADPRTAGKTYDDLLANAALETSEHEHESVTTPDGHGAYCRVCGDTLA